MGTEERIKAVERERQKRSRIKKRSGDRIGLVQRKGILGTGWEGGKGEGGR